MFLNTPSRGALVMSYITTDHIREYLRYRPLPRVEVIDDVREVASVENELRFIVRAGDQRYLFKWYPPNEAEPARREVEGLRVAGVVGLAPPLIVADEVGGTLGGPVVITQQTAGTPLDAGHISDADADAWLFLLLTLHHLPPDQVRVDSSLSPDLVTWWQRMQPAWDFCRNAFAAPPYQPLLDLLTQLHLVASARVEAHRGLWRRLPRHVCHGNPVAANVLSDGGRLMFIEWEGFGLGDPALEIGRTMVLATLEDHFDATQYSRMLMSYLAGTRDLRDATLEQRIDVFTSVLPLGYSFYLLALLAPDAGGAATANAGLAPTERSRTLDQAGRALAWVQGALGILDPAPAVALAPLVSPR